MIDSRITELAEALDRAKGGVATVWDYTASLSQLTLRITWPGTSENLHLVCNGCTRIEAATAWRLVDPAFELLPSGGVLLFDAGANFAVTCGLVRVFQNVEPRYRTTAA